MMVMMVMVMMVMIMMIMMMMRAGCRRHQTRWVEMQGIVTQF
jgi:hypothetical protein